MDFLKDIVKEIGDDLYKTPHPILTILKHMWIRVRTFLTDLYQVVFLGVYLVTRLLPLLVSLLLARLSLVSPLLKIFWITILTVTVCTLTLKQQLNKSLLADRDIDLDRVVVVNVVTIEEFRSKALKAVDIYLKKDADERKPCMFVLDSLGMLSTGEGDY